MILLCYLIIYMKWRTNYINITSCILSILSYPCQIQLRAEPAHDLLESSQHLLLLEKELACRWRTLSCLRIWAYTFDSRSFAVRACSSAAPPFASDPRIQTIVIVWRCHCLRLTTYSIMPIRSQEINKFWSVTLAYEDLLWKWRQHH